MQPEEILNRACEALAAILKNFRCSSIYKTKPRYVENQADFYNMAVSGEWGGKDYEKKVRRYEQAILAYQKRIMELEAQLKK